MMKIKTALWAAVFAAVFLCGCLPSGKTKTPKLDDDALIFFQAQKALDVHDYPDAAKLLTIFLKEFPEVKHYSWGLQRMGEAMQGLLQTHYLQLLQSDSAEPTVREKFLASYGTYNCWTTESDRLNYDGSHYRTLLKDHPDSNIADEAAYRLALLQTAAADSIENIEQEVQALAQVLERYPRTSLRYEIYYTMAYRYHQLYERSMYGARGEPSSREEAQRYKEKSAYLYSLALKSPRHSRFAEKAWQNLQDLEDGRRIFP